MSSSFASSLSPSLKPTASPSILPTIGTTDLPGGRSDGVAAGMIIFILLILGIGICSLRIFSGLKDGSSDLNEGAYKNVKNSESSFHNINSGQGNKDDDFDDTL
jgi:hypothetical protein